MKTKFYTFVALLATTLSGFTTISAQTVTDTIYMGPGYANEIYYSMSAGNKGTISRKQWDIAFRASRMSASILTNDAANNTALGVNGVELYTYPNADTSGWATLDTAGISGWPLMINSTTDWETGAFCVNQKGHPDYGWGKYNSVSHNVVGDSLYIIKLRDGSYRKLWIKEKFSSLNSVLIRYANLDGSNDMEVTVDCSPYSTKNFVGYSLVTSEVVDFEPVDATQWDILFTKYMYTYPDGPNYGSIYPVTGVLSNYDIKVNTFKDVDLTFMGWDVATMDSTRSPIGWEWKVLNNATFTYEVVDRLVYFIQDLNGNIHKLVFKEFVGSSSGRIVLERTMISAAAVGENAKSDVNATVYPNPVHEKMNLVINPGKNSTVVLSLLSISGQEVYTDQLELQSETLQTVGVPVTGLKSGVYVLNIKTAAGVVSKKIVINN